MKVILKGGNPEKNKEIEEFFINNILPILDFGIALESSNRVITVYEKKDNGEIKKYVDPTAEVIVELSEEARHLAQDLTSSKETLQIKSGKFIDEALAIQEIEKKCPPFSIEYYSCRYTPSASSESKQS